MDTYIGYFAAFCTTAAFIPQAFKVYKTRQTKDISLGMFFLLITGVVLWLVYGILLNSIPIISANLVTFGLSTYILIVKIRNEKVQREPLN